MYRSAMLVVLGLLVAACASAAGVPDPSAAPSATIATTATSSASPAPGSTETPTGDPGMSRLRAEVISVTDGDTIRVRIDGQSVPVRYIGIDTPETVDPRQTVQCFGREASARNAQLVAGKVVELEKDVSETDRFQRLLRYVYVDGVMVNEELVRGGYATAVSYPPDVKYQDRFRALEAEARAAGVGLWAEGACSAATPTVAPTAGTTTGSPASLTVTITTSTYGTIRATTMPGASCTAQARLPSGNVSQAQALQETRTADAAGTVVWSYGTSSTTQKGTGTHTVTCRHGGQTSSASAPFTVQ